MYRIIIEIWFYNYYNSRLNFSSYSKFLFKSTNEKKMLSQNDFSSSHLIQDPMFRRRRSWMDQTMRETTTNRIPHRVTDFLLCFRISSSLTRISS